MAHAHHLASFSDATEASLDLYSSPVQIDSCKLALVVSWVVSPRPLLSARCRIMDDRPYKIVLAGKHGVGKTTIFHELQNLSDSTGMNTVETGTGISGRKNREKWMVHTHSRGRDVTVQLWDTGGMEQHGRHNMTNSYFSKSSAVILICDKGNIETLNDLGGWIDLARGHTSDDLVFSIWVNNSENDITPLGENSVINFAESKDIPKALVFEVTASSGDNLIDSFKKVVDAIHLADTNLRRYKEEFGIVDVCMPKQNRNRSRCSC